MRPLECNLKTTYFLNIGDWGPEDVFDEVCIDFEAGDSKPEIRVHGRAMFNITNFAHFENVTFSGIDAMATIENT